jgi:transglutaminase-like putative cysteine protease
MLKLWQLIKIIWNKIKSFFEKPKDPGVLEDPEVPDVRKMYDENYWNSKWATAPITYAGRVSRVSTKTIIVDVKDFIMPNDILLQELITRHSLKKDTANSTAWEIQKFVVDFLTYKYDDESQKCPEFWQFPFETLQSQIGDCEDGAILTAALCVAAGIPAWRIKVAAGWVQDSPTAPEGGHAYCIFLADRPESERQKEWIILDWCYYEDTQLFPENKPLAKDGGFNNCYKEVWFTFNNEFSWNQTQLEIGKGRISKNRTLVLEDTIRLQNNQIEKVMNLIAKKLSK